MLFQIKLNLRTIVTNVQLWGFKIFESNLYGFSLKNLKCYFIYFLKLLTIFGKIMWWA